MQKSVPAGNFTYNGLPSKDLILSSFSMHMESDGSAQRKPSNP